MSLLFAAQSEAAGPDEPDSGVERFRIAGGNSLLPDAFARRLGRRVRLSSPVVGVQQGSGEVRATTASGETFGAAWAVLAAPLPALRRISFSPALPATLAGAVARLQYGNATKVLLQYRRRFWTARGYSGDSYTRLPVGATWAATSGQAGAAGVLIGYTTGTDGAAFARLGDRRRIARATRDLNTLYPGSAALLGRTATVAWANEPYTGGSYTAFAPGQVVPYWDALREPAGRIVLAGEHTDSQFIAYMEGALRSGRTAASVIRSG